MIVDNQFDCSADPVDGIKKLKEFQRMDLAGEQSRAPGCAAPHQRLHAADHPDHRHQGITHHQTCNSDWTEGDSVMLASWQDRGDV
jgi:hypothetical protein